MVIKVDGKEFSPYSGIQEGRSMEGAKALKITVVSTTYDEVKASFTNARLVEMIDSEEKEMAEYTGYNILQYIKDNVEMGMIEVLIRRPTTEEQLKNQEAEITEIQEAIVE